MTTTVQYLSQTYEVEDNGACFVIKTRNHSRTYGGRGSSSTYRSKITSPRKLKVLRILAGVVVRPVPSEPDYEYEDRLNPAPRIDEPMEE